MDRRIFFFITIFLLALRPLAADDALDALLLKAPFADVEKRSIATVFSLAREQRIPESLLLPRLEEGLAKRIPAGRLVPVLRSELDFLSRARAVLTAADPLLAAESQPSIWQRAALLLHNGVPDAVVGAIAFASAKRWPDFRAATELYLDLTAWGLEPADAQAIAVAVLGSRLRASDFGGVTALFPKGRARYLAPRVLAGRIVKALPGVETAADLADRVLY
jgi:hypothetical protein